MNFIPNVPPKVFTLSAIAVGYLLIDDLTANEQNALGNWLMLTAQVICTNAFYKQVEQERNPNSQNNNSSNNQSNNTTNEQAEIEMLKKMVKALNQEIENLKSNIGN